MSPWTHYRNEMFGEVVNLLMLMLREKNPFLPTQGWHVLGGPASEADGLGSLAGRSESVKSLGVSQGI